MKLAITGKGGAGKTTVAVFLAKYLAERDTDVILIDADPDANTALSLGLDASMLPEPISELKDLIAERTGAGGAGGQLYTLNPKVDDIPDRYALSHDGIRVLRMGRLARGGSGCFCPENAFLKNLLSHLLFQGDQVVILDMEAGIEHLGRGTAQGVDAMLTVVEPGQRSVETALAIKRYAEDIGLSRIGVIINKYRSEEQLETVSERLAPLPVLGRFPYDEAIAESDLAGACPYTGSEEQREWVRQTLAALEEFIGNPEGATQSCKLNGMGGTDG